MASQCGCRASTSSACPSPRALHPKRRALKRRAAHSPLATRPRALPRRRAPTNRNPRAKRSRAMKRAPNLPPLQSRQRSLPNPRRAWSFCPPINARRSIAAQRFQYWVLPRPRSPAVSEPADPRAPGPPASPFRPMARSDPLRYRRRSPARRRAPAWPPYFVACACRPSAAAPSPCRRAFGSPSERIAPLHEQRNPKARGLSAVRTALYAPPTPKRWSEWR